MRRKKRVGWNQVPLAARAILQEFHLAADNVDKTILHPALPTTNQLLLSLLLYLPFWFTDMAPPPSVSRTIARRRARSKKERTTSKNNKSHNQDILTFPMESMMDRYEGTNPRYGSWLQRSYNGDWGLNPTPLLFPLESALPLADSCIQIYN